MKKFTSLLLAALMLLSVFAVIPAAAAETGAATGDTIITVDTFSYAVSNGEATVLSYNSSNSYIKIPDTANGYPVTAIADEAFLNDTKVRTLVLPAGLKEIGDRAFDGLVGTVTFHYPKTKAEWDKIAIGSDNAVLKPGNIVYCSGQKIAYKIIDNKVKIFDGKDTEPNLVVPETIEGYTVDTILGYAFSDYHDFESISLPDTVTSIGYEGFSMNSIKTLYLGRGIKDIVDMAFDSNNNLKDVYYNGTSEDWAKVQIGGDNDDLLNATIHYVKKINSAGAVNVVTPVTGTNPVLTADPVHPECYSVYSVSWYNTTDGKAMKTTDTFEEGKQYRLSIDLKAVRGYMFDFTNVKGTINDLSVSRASADDKDTRDYVRLQQSFIARKTIANVFVTGVQVPVVGETITNNATAGSSAYSIVNVDWYCKTDNKAYVTGKFKGAKVYDVRLFVKANDGYNFKVDGSSIAVTATVNGETATKITGVYGVDETEEICLHYTFPATGDEVLNKVEFTEFVEPQVGANPVSACTVTEGVTITDTSFWCNSVKLKSSDKFEAGKTYNVNFKITANDGYQFAVNESGWNAFSAYLNGNANVKQVIVDKLSEVDAKKETRVRFYFELPAEPTEPTEPTETVTETQPVETVTETQPVETVTETQPTETETQPVETVTETQPTETETTPYEPNWSDWEVGEYATVGSSGYEIRYDLNNPSVTEQREIPAIDTITTPKFVYTYTGKAIQPKVTITDIEGNVLTEDVDYTIDYPNPASKNVSLYSAEIHFMGLYNGVDYVQYQIAPAKQPIKIKAVAKSVKVAKVKKAKQTVKKAITVTKNKGKVTFTRVKKGSSKYLKISKKGVITVAKGKYKKGAVLKIKVTITAAATKNYKKYTKTVTVKIKVK